MRRTEKNGTVDSVHRTYKLCCYRNTPNRSHAIFAWHESTLDVHPKNSFMVSNLTTGNSGQLKMSPKIPSVAKRRFWIWPGCGPQIAGCGLQATGCGLLCCRPQICGLQAKGWGLQAAGHRLRATGHRLHLNLQFIASWDKGIK